VLVLVLPSSEGCVFQVYDMETAGEGATRCYESTEHEGIVGFLVHDGASQRLYQDDLVFAL
jgi:hypothetical protein